MGLFAVDFRKTARNWWVYWSVIGHRLKVGAADGKDKVHERCRWCGLGWKCGKEGYTNGEPFPFLHPEDFSFARYTNTACFL